MKYNSWRSLIGETQLCEGGRLSSIVFCCDPRKNFCPILDIALHELGIEKEDFIKIMDKHDAYNLAFCPSLEKEDKKRDEILLKNNWGPSKYLQYKFEILEELLGKRIEEAFSKRLFKQFAMEILDPETSQVYKTIALGDLKNKIFIVTEIVEESKLEEKIEEDLEKLEFVGVRMPKNLIKKIDEMISLGYASSRSDLIRKSLHLYLSIKK
jgi:predicted metal-binding transcription factor (methanogenesis marker protein 9)